MKGNRKFPEPASDPKQSQLPRQQSKEEKFITKLQQHSRTKRQYRRGDFQQQVRRNFWTGQRQQYFPSSWPNQQSFQSHRFPNGHHNYSEDETLANLMEEQEEQMINQNQSFPAGDQQSQT